MAFNFGEYKSGNPTLRKAFQSTGAVVDANTMTVSGAINKTGILFVLLAFGGYYGWDLAGSPNLGMTMGGSILIAFILSLIIIFKREWSPILAPAYAVLEGVAIGAITSMYEMSRPGIAFNAMCLTFGTLGMMLALYHFKVIRYSPRFQQILMMATGAVLITYIVELIMGFMGHSVMFLHDSSPLGIGISCVIVVIAALNLIVDFEVVTQGAAMRAPKYMEWYSGFALMVTLVWLYLEILKLLSRLSKR